MREEKFIHNETEYTIRIIERELSFDIRVFKGMAPANAYTYSISLDTSFDFGRQYGISGLRHLIDTAKADVIEGRWEEHLEIIKKQKEIDAALGIKTDVANP